jgi:hypothetical protein
MTETVSPAYAAWHELRHFVGQTTLTLVPSQERPPARRQLVDFTDLVLVSGHSRAELYDEVIHFVTNSCRVVKELESQGIRWPGGAGPAVEGVGLERLMIAGEMERRGKLNGWDEGPWWRVDIGNILSFFSQTSQRRYEKTSPQLTVAYYPEPAAGGGYGVLGKSLLDQYKALLRLCRDGHTIVVVQRGCTITDIMDNQRFDKRSHLKYPVPPRLAHLQQLSEKGYVVFNLNSNASMEIFAAGQLVFRKVNDVWRFLSVGSVLKLVKDELAKCGGNVQIARNLLSLAMDLADRGEGALLYVCDEPTDAVLESVLVPGEGLIRSLGGWPNQELTPRMMFTELIGRRQLCLSKGPYHAMTPLLRDLCSIDGATVFSYKGLVLGFGCLVAIGASDVWDPRRRKEGARSAAAKFVSKKGLAIKVSSDGDAIVFIEEKETGPLF